MSERLELKISRKAMYFLQIYRKALFPDRELSAEVSNGYVVGRAFEEIADVGHDINWKLIQDYSKKITTPEGSFVTDMRFSEKTMKALDEYRDLFQKFFVGRVYRPFVVKLVLLAAYQRHTKGKDFMLLIENIMNE